MDTKRTEPEQAESIELRPDGESRFEQAIDMAVRTAAIRKTKGEDKPSIVKRKP